MDKFYYVLISLGFVLKIFFSKKIGAKLSPPLGEVAVEGGVAVLRTTTTPTTTTNPFSFGGRCFAPTLWVASQGRASLLRGEAPLPSPFGGGASHQPFGLLRRGELRSSPLAKHPHLHPQPKGLVVLRATRGERSSLILTLLISWWAVTLQISLRTLMGFRILFGFLLFLIMGLEKSLSAARRFPSPLKQWLKWLFRCLLRASKFLCTTATLLFCTVTRALSLQVKLGRLFLSKLRSEAPCFSGGGGGGGASHHPLHLHPPRGESFAPKENLSDIIQKLDASPIMENEVVSRTECVVLSMSAAGTPGHNSVNENWNWLPLFPSAFGLRPSAFGLRRERSI
jgi:hypothetical protein